MCHLYFLPSANKDFHCRRMFLDSAHLERLLLTLLLLLLLLLLKSVSRRPHLNITGRVNPRWRARLSDPNLDSHSSRRSGSRWHRGSLSAGRVPLNRRNVCRPYISPLPPSQSWRICPSWPAPDKLRGMQQLIRLPVTGSHVKPPLRELKHVAIRRVVHQTAAHLSASVCLSRRISFIQKRRIIWYIDAGRYRQL